MPSGRAAVERELGRCGSTQDELLELARGGALAWSWVRADEQTAGRGRRGRRWEAAPGSALLVSVLLRPARSPAELPELTLVAALAVCEAVRALGPEARLRWPNDVVVGGRKLAGLLAELEPDPAVLLGIGLNLRGGETELPAAERLSPTSLELEGVAPVDAGGFWRELVLPRLRSAVGAWEAVGLAAHARRLAELDDLRERELQLRLAGGTVVEGVGAGIADDGALLVRGPGGVEAHRSGEVHELRWARDPLPESGP
jgi:BirA family biotin operon repressor/biotin-[acetyl-CoA-carboxylase] ligase